MQKDSNYDEAREPKINIKELLFHYLSKWYWFVAGAVIFLFLAHMYLRYSIPQYSASATILVKDDKKGGMVSEVAALSEMDMMGTVKSSVDNEMEILKSRTLIEYAVRDLGLNIRYYSEGRVKAIELYKLSPVKIVFEDPIIDNYFYKLQPGSGDDYKLLDAEDNSLGTFKYGQLVKRPEGNFTILNSENGRKESTITITATPTLRTAQMFKSRIGVRLVGEKTSVVEVSIVDPVKQRAEDFLNAIVANYNRDAVNDKNIIFKNTSDFIEERLALIAGELGDVERSGEVYKKTNQITNIVSEAELFLENASEAEKEFLSTETQLRVVESLNNYVRKASSTDLIPDNILTTFSADANFSPTLISEYNTLLLERERLLPSAGPQNRSIRLMDSQLSSLKQNIIANLGRLKNTLEIKRRDLAARKSSVSGQISEIPTQEREYKGILRQQTIKESLYLYLLQKREETAISLASTSPNAKIIDSALTSDSPVSPRANIVYLGALLLGCFIPFGIIYLRDLLDTKIHSQKDLGKLSVPYLGDVPKADANNEIITLHSRTSTAEALRIVRTNVEFLLSHVNENVAKTIFVTSTIPKEGKTFVSINLAATIALAGKKVLLLAMDIRNPKFSEYLDLPEKGMTNYLATPSANHEDFIVAHKTLANFFIFPAGVIPPNPAELLMDGRVAQLFEKLQAEYDYIVVDTAPISLVTDTQIIAKFAHCFVYVVRANHLDKQMLEIPERLYIQNKLPNMAILLNDTNESKGYGYGPGYGYDDTSSKRSKIKSFFKKKS